MTHLRRMMLEELQGRNYAKSTVKAYVRIIQEFARHFHQPPDRLGPRHLRQYQAYLFQEKKFVVTNRWVIFEFAELSESGLNGVGSVGYVNTDVFTTLGYRPNSESACGGW